VSICPGRITKNFVGSRGFFAIIQMNRLGEAFDIKQIAVIAVALVAGIAAGPSLVQDGRTDKIAVSTQFSDGSH